MHMPQRARRGWAFLLFLTFLAAGGRADVSDPFSRSVGEAICDELSDGEGSFRIGTISENTESGEELVRFYERMGCRPVWSEGNGVDFKALLLINALVNAREEGLQSSDPAYNLEAILALMGRIKADPSLKDDPDVLAQLDILMSDAYMMLAGHLYYGAVRREGVFDTWNLAPKKKMGWGEYLRDALENNTLPESIERLSPDHKGYRQLRNLLIRYLRIQESGGWNEIVYEDPKEVREFRSDEIKARLRAEGDMADEDESAEGLREGIVRFQLRHGIMADGVVGNETLEKMNIPVETKIGAIRLNMERWRWMPQSMGSPYIEVNVPAFYLSVAEEGEELFSMKAIIGREERPTPIFNARMTYIVVNPYWRVPETILREDIIPKMRKNAGYLAKERIRIFRHGDEKGVHPIRPSLINWKMADAATFPYYLRQDAGKKNALGRLKFMFPNPYDIYIHDTPERHLFDKMKRSYSSGCIRIEEPLKLAEYLLVQGGQEGQLSSLQGGGANRTFPLSRPLNVYISYWTVWEDGEGMAHFRDDLYGYDLELSQMLGWDFANR